MKTITFFLLLVVGCVVRAADTDFRALTGKYAFRSANIVDPQPGEKFDRMVFFLEGKGAVDLFERMPQKAVRSECAGDLVSKTAGDLVCSKERSGDVFCSFAIDMRRGRLVNGRAC